MNIDNRSVHLIDNFLKPHECDQIIAYANSLKKYEEFLGRKIYLWKNISIVNPRIFLTYKKYVRKISNQFNFNLNFGQIVEWHSGLSCDIHKDITHPADPCGDNFWTTVCYLNDDYQGGETIVNNQTFRPKKGQLLVFNGKVLSHGVSKIYGTRYTMIAWWSL